ncbi:hypothetical protein ACVWYG_002581 [Pedobacter sp. UYEF25]
MHDRIQQIQAAIDKQALINWDKFIINESKQFPVNINESELEKRKRVEKLEGNDEAWFKYYCPNFYSSEPAPFHIRSTKLVMRNPEYFLVRPWSRELAKSGRTMMEALKLSLTKKKRNWFLGSNSYDNAVRLLMPYKSILENNARIINDYGIQKNIGHWESGEFTTKSGFSFRAIGAGQSPRGARQDEYRPDGIIVDDFDTDAKCRNPDTVTEDYDWLERALIPTRSISVPLLVIFNGNIIAEYSCITLAMKVADSFEIVNIRDENGVSTWPQKNTEAFIDIALRVLSYKAQQGEYYNNPITEGKVFEKLYYGQMRPLKEYKFLISYTDPSYKKKGDFKATALIGRWRDQYHVLKAYCAQTTTSDMLDWNYEIYNYVRGVVPIYFIIEWPWIDDLLKIEIKAANIKHGITIHPVPDPRDKPDKYHRIESTLNPLNRNGYLIFNKDLQENPHMVAMEGQFKALSPTSRAHDDGPDAVEGGVSSLNARTINDVSKIETIQISRKGTKHY